MKDNEAGYCQELEIAPTSSNAFLLSDPKEKGTSLKQFLPALALTCGLERGKAAAGVGKKFDQKEKFGKKSSKIIQNFKDSLTPSGCAADIMC